MIEETGKCDQLHQNYQMQVDAQKRTTEKLRATNIKIENLRQNTAKIRQEIAAAKSNNPKSEAETRQVDAVAKSQNEVNEAVQLASLIGELERELSSLMMMLANAEKEAADLKREIATTQIIMDNIASEIVSI
ncbi:hypothetical protein MNBD_ALPHA11-2259, partial [hydrothermal vent metagenome]